MPACRGDGSRLTTTLISPQPSRSKISERSSFTTRRDGDEESDGSLCFRRVFPFFVLCVALGLLDSMRATLPEETLKQLLNQQAEDKAQHYRHLIGEGTIGQRLEHLASLRRDEGYITTCSPESDGLSWRLQEVHCSVQRIAEEFPAVCDQELLLIRSTVPDCQVERVHWRLEGGHACGFRITPFEK